jgi:choline-sulfatase
MKPKNLLFIMSDEHSRRVLGCYKHPMIRTPHLDALARRGVRFSDAYCNSPICVPSRASFHTGRYPHQIRFWDNGMPYDGSVTSWGHRLKQNGHCVTSIGKLHFRSTGDNNGFTEEIMPLHVVDGIGDPSGMIRRPLVARTAALKLAGDAGAGDSDYQRYDDSITAAAEHWLRERERRCGDRPWMLFVSLVCPHFPLIARPQWYDLYPEDAMPRPALYATEDRPQHPYVSALRECMIYDKGFDEIRLRKALAGYFGLVSFVDHNVGRLLACLAETGLDEETRVIYTSDHGDNLGSRGLWGKSSMYEESAGVPLIMAGADIPEGAVCREPVSLVDCYQTIVDCVGAPRHPDDAALPGTSLFEILNGSAPHRTILCEYHAAGAATGAFMIRKGSYKYVYYIGMPPQLFDLDLDPQEERDRGQDPRYSGVASDCETLLRRVVDPEAADRQAFADQAARIDQLGGRDAVLARGSFGFSPVPGTKPVYSEMQTQRPSQPTGDAA